MLEDAGGVPGVLMACVGGGSNSIGALHAFVPDKSVAIIGVEAGGRGKGLGDNAATLSYGSPGVLQGSFSMLLQDQDGQIQEPHSVSAGLDFSAFGPPRPLLPPSGRCRYPTAPD